DKVFRRDVLWRAWVAVRRNDGAPGIDKTTLDQVEQYGVTRLLDELAAEMKGGGYRPLPALLLPKTSSAQVRRRARTRGGCRRGGRVFVCRGGPSCPGRR